MKTTVLLLFSSLLAILLCMSNSLARFILVAMSIFTVALGGLALLCLFGAGSAHLPLFARVMFYLGFVAYGLILPVLWRAHLRRCRHNHRLSIENFLPSHH